MLVGLSWQFYRPIITGVANITSATLFSDTHFRPGQPMGRGQFNFSFPPYCKMNL